MRTNRGLVFNEFAAWFPKNPRWTREIFLIDQTVKRQEKQRSHIMTWATLDLLVLELLYKLKYMYSTKKLSIFVLKKYLFIKMSLLFLT